MTPPTINLPSSKSISARALIINALAAEPCELLNLSDCDDTRALQAVLQGGGDIGAAGTAMRFATALLAATPGVERTLTGTARMLERPIGVLVDALRQLGADIEYTGREGYPPLHIRGRRLTTEDLPENEEGMPTLTLPAHISSQYISALLMIAPTIYSPPFMGGAGGGSLSLSLIGSIASRPYIEMTRALMAEWGAQTEWKDDHTLYIYSREYHRTEPYEVEADWSAASYFLAVRRDIVLPGLRRPSVQGDSIIVDYLRQMDSSPLPAPPLGESSCPETNGLTLDFSQCPDIAQTMVVAACLADCPFHFTGLESLRIKETDRIAALIAECAKFGWELTEPAPGTLAFSPHRAEGSPPKGERGGGFPVTVATYHDHRMAMAFALCLERWPDTTFDDPMVVTKSFPNFWQEFHKLIPLNPQLLS
ncbi:MAG: 3-phosphoshikimate 1-carboxyvinyltransferase [Bacteroidaceae bacterium]|nr:3-phosphoshikimate 1-carboxyvinyltransferase [Bacteroidaceae bacterium]